MALGLWLSAESAAALAEGEGAARLRDWLLENDLRVDSLNGFPYGDFHGAAVKHAVYRPNWLDRRRLDYTRTLAELLAVLLPDGAAGGISTLPLGWRTDVTGEGALAACAVHMRELCDDLRRIEEQTGRCVHVDIEPEPGCALQGSGELVQFFERHLDRGAARDVLARYLRACHDVCHAAVCFEQQADVLAGSAWARCRCPARRRPSSSVAPPRTR